MGKTDAAKRRRVGAQTHELESGRYDEVVLDTAPSRHALEFLDYPGRLGRMLEARTLEWMVGLAKLAGSTLDDRPDDDSAKSTPSGVPQRLLT
ncbi:MAG: hypothetical protein HYZ29_11020, partial [Myxococcales bacterium]|nr:hypothetical protein [Myxococcales bacterium]